MASLSDIKLQIDALRQETQPAAISPQVVASILDNLNNYLTESVYSKLALDEFIRDVNSALNICNDLSKVINNLIGLDASEAIDNFNEIKSFLDGIKDTESLFALLDTIRERISIAEQTGTKAQTSAATATLLSESAINQCSALYSSKMDKWQPLLNETYFNHSNYRWARVSFLADNAYFHTEYQEFETFDIDIQSLVSQRESTGVEVFSIIRWVGAHPGEDNPANWKAVRFNVVVGGDMMNIILNAPSSNAFGIRTYLMK